LADASVLLSRLIPEVGNRGALEDGRKNESCSRQTDKEVSKMAKSTEKLGRENAQIQEEHRGFVEHDYQFVGDLSSEEPLNILVREGGYGWGADVPFGLALLAYATDHGCVLRTRWQQPCIR